MLRTLRSRLIASHVGLLLFLIPLLGVVLIYVLESRVVLVNMGRQLTGQAVLVGELLKQDPAALRDPAGAAAFVARTVPLFPGELSILDARGGIVATSDIDSSEQGREFNDMPGLADALQGRQYSRVMYSRDQRAEVVEVMVPVLGQDGGVQAVVRITDRLSTLLERFRQLRILIAAVLAAGLLIGTVLGYFLSVTVERPLLQLTDAVEGYPQRAPTGLTSSRGPNEVRVLARAFQGMLDRIQHLEENRRYLLSNIVHELGRPLGALRAADRALLDGAADEPGLRDELLRGIDGEINRMEQVLEELARLRDGAADQPALQAECIELTPWLHDLLAPWREAALAAGLTWQADIPAGLPSVSIDPSRLGQAFGNLVSNAVKYTPAGGQVRVSASADTPKWRITVADTGPGIREADRERIFEAFYRTPPERRYPQGLGLGLTIARNLVRAHGGDICVESRSGPGACFTVTLPLHNLSSSSA